MNYPIYPDDFDDNKDGVAISNEKINEWLIDGVIFLERNKNEFNWFCQSGDTRVEVRRVYYDNKGLEQTYEVNVFKKFEYGGSNVFMVDNQNKVLDWSLYNKEENKRLEMLEEIDELEQRIKELRERL